ncbi:MAG TPA: HAD-IIB family hydrolase [Trueperaceae bacterium]|nr:HAD-IIB family hydrolase [Trueperaceae bacterium]
MRAEGPGTTLMRTGRRTLVSDVDGTLLDAGSPGAGAARLGERLRAADAALVLSSGRGLELSLEAAAVLEGGGLPRPAGLVCGVGTQIYLWDGGRYVPDAVWRDQLAASGFDAEAVRRALAPVPGLEPQPPEADNAFKVSFFVEPRPDVDQVVADARAALEDAAVPARTVYSAGRYVDVLAPNASKGSALVHLSGRYGLSGHDVVATGDSGNDRELLMTAAAEGMVAVLVANHEPEMSDMRSVRGVVLAEGRHCLGVLEGLDAAGW